MRALASCILVPASLFMLWGCGPGDTPDAGPSCEPGCDGDTLVRCDGDAETRTDCTDVSGTCAESGDDFGCQVGVGDNCLPEVDGEFLLTLCEGTDAACHDDSNAAVCVEGHGPCDEADEGTCDGELYTSECFGGQPLHIECDAYGSTCTAGTGCVGEAGDFCDEVDHFCASGLSCGDDFLCE